MCTGLETILTIASIASGVGGTLYSASATAAANNAQAAQNETNAIIASNNAEDARQRGIVAQQDVQMRNRARIGQQKNELSEKNISVSSGSALDILGDTAAFGKLDEITTKNNYEREAIAYENQSNSFSAQAEQDRAAASNATTAGVFSAFSTGLGGAVKGFGKKGISFGS